MKLLIVEDEPHVRERLEEGIDWADHHVELAAAVGSSREAVMILQKEHIDIVLTDIQMPEMSGLELGKWIKSEYPHVKLLILTGHDDFEYAREGIECGVLKYLVKPAENEVIVQAVLGAKGIRERELQDKINLALLEQRWKEHLPRLKEMFYKNWLNGHYSQWEIVRRGEELSLRLNENRFLPAILDMDPISQHNDRFQVQDRSLVQFSLFTMARDILVEDSVVLQDDDGMTAVVFMAERDEKEDVLYAKVNQKINGLLSAVKDCLKLTASAGIGPCVAEASRLPQAYMQSRMALHERIVLGSEAVISFRNQSAVQDPWLYMSDLEKEMEVAIEAGNLGSWTGLIAKVMEISFSPASQAADAKEMLLRITCLLARIVHTHGWTLREVLADHYPDFENFHQLLTKEQISEWFLRMARSISSAIAERRKSGTQINVEEILRFIQERLHDDELSLYLVAENMYINYSYLSRMFKEVTGSSFSEHVLRARMEKAKELLTRGVKVYDAAQQVGYRHVNYFSKSFQKYWGIKPSEMYK
jgi:two-component system response regulator YesN